jgi:hypothetical protein
VGTVSHIPRSSALSAGKIQFVFDGGTWASKGLFSQIDSLNIAPFGGFRQPNKALTTRAWILLPLSVG